MRRRAGRRLALAVGAAVVAATMIGAVFGAAGASPGEGAAAVAAVRASKSRQGPAAVAVPSSALQLVRAARAQVGVTLGYDPSYVRLSYPGGDVDPSTGVCADVIVRALRTLGVDLQQRIHVDMAANFRAYPTKWGLSRTDTNIDHRRVGNIATYFGRRGYGIAVTTNARDYLPGDIVVLKIPLDHIGIVSDRRQDGRPLLIHNVGGGAQEEDVLFAWTIVGHYRVLTG